MSGGHGDGRRAEDGGEGQGGGAAPGGDAGLRARMLAEVAAGLARSQKEIPPKYFYDHRGSQLFEEITRLPEYYPTRAERALLEAWAPGFVARLAPRCLVELGAGAADKTRILLSAMRATGAAVTYVPVDISGKFLSTVARGLRDEYPDLEVRPVTADITTEFELPADPARPTLFALLGGTIGNFEPSRASALLHRVRSGMHPEDRFLLGADLEKDVAVMEAAYNDARGVTADFNLNVLRVLNRFLAADFDLDCFRHRAFYNRDAHRIEMHVVACRAHSVTLPDVGSFHFEEGETIRTEISCKYDRPRVQVMLEAAGLTLDAWVEGAEGFALVVAAPGP